MTVIVGINLSDRIYVAGDSRLSYEVDGQQYVRHDNMRKVENVPNSKNITVASAGNARMAQFILNRLGKANFTKDGIAVFRDEIKEWLKPVVDEYFTANGFSRVTFIFAGSDPKSTKKVSSEKVYALASAYTGGQGIIKANPHLGKAIVGPRPKQDTLLNLKIADTKLFSVEIGPGLLEITDANYGDMLMYGPPGLVKEDIKQEHIASFEFDPHMHDNGSGAGNDIALLNAFIYSQAEKHKLGSVGGSVVVFSNEHDGKSTIITGSVYSVPIDKLDEAKLQGGMPADHISSITISGDTFYRVDGRTRYKLIPVSEYKPKEKGDLFL